VWSIGLWSPGPEDLHEEDDGDDDARWGTIGIDIVNPNDPG
jgi:hypothetical protein